MTAKNEIREAYQKGRMETPTVLYNKIDVGERFRKKFDDARLSDLVESIKNVGLLSPISVLEKGPDTDHAGQELDKEKPYLLLAGERRFRALGIAGIENVPVHIYRHRPTKAQLRRVELHENIVREDLTWQESTALKKELHDLEVSTHGEKVGKSADSLGHSIRDTAKMLGESHATVSRDLQLAEAVERNPELAEAKTKKEAFARLDKIKRKLALEELAKRQTGKKASSPDDKQKKELIDAYIVSDFFQGVQKLPEESIDFVEIDPPYGIDLQQQKKYNERTGVVDGYNEVENQDYVDFISRVMTSCYRVMKPRAWGVCWFGPEPWFEPVYQAIIQAGFRGTRIPLIWAKGAGQSQHPHIYLANTYEMGFYFRKGDAGLIKMGRSNIFTYTPVHGTKKVHPTQRPIALMESVLETFAFPSSRVLVPFAGSGVTLLAANNLKMNPIGFDLSTTYKNEYSAAVVGGTLGAYTDS